MSRRRRWSGFSTPTAPRSSSTCRSALSRRANHVYGMTATRWSAGGSSSGPRIDTRPTRVIVFTNLLRHHQTGGICLMHLRGSTWRGWLVCAVVSLLLVLPAAVLAAEGAGEHAEGGGGLISIDKS